MNNGHYLVAYRKGRRYAEYHVCEYGIEYATKYYSYCLDGSNAFCKGYKAALDSLRKGNRK